jgi:hypothetical protein
MLSLTGTQPCYPWKPSNATQARSSVHMHVRSVQRPIQSDWISRQAGQVHAWVVRCRISQCLESSSLWQHQSWAGCLTQACKHYCYWCHIYISCQLSPRTDEPRFMYIVLTLRRFPLRGIMCLVTNYHILHSRNSSYVVIQKRGEIHYI